MAPFDFTCEISDIQKNHVTAPVFVRLIEGKILLKMVVPEVVETPATIKFCVKGIYISQMKCFIYC